MSLLRIPPKDVPSDFYSVKRAYTEFKVCQKTIYKLIATGKIPQSTRWHAHYCGWSAAEIVPILERLYVYRVAK